VTSEPIAMSTATDAAFSHRLALKPGAAARPATRRVADATERAAVAERLAIAAVGALEVEAVVECVDGVYRCRGEVRAQVVQACVVTGAPVAQAVEAGFERFVVVGDTPASVGELEIDPDERDVDFVDEPVVDLGDIAVEELALALEPYPRAADADATLAAVNRAVDDAPLRRPFAVLAQRRGPS
jgi:uncharacterized metal-binding protein YceD (DUF177 family)